MSRHPERGEGGVEAEEVTGSNFFWTLRLPLSTDTAGWGFVNLYREFGGDGLLMDVNYLSNLFQKELALAAERVFTGASAVEPSQLNAASTPKFAALRG